MRIDEVQLLELAHEDHLFIQVVHARHGMMGLHRDAGDEESTECDQGERFVSSWLLQVHDCSPDRVATGRPQPQGPAPQHEIDGSGRSPIVERRTQANPRAARGWDRTVALTDHRGPDIVQVAAFDLAFPELIRDHVFFTFKYRPRTIDVHGRRLRRKRADSGAAAAFPPTDVQTVTLEPKPVPRSSEFVATVRSLRSTTVQPQVDGFVRQIFVKAGDRVAAGAPLVQIDPDCPQATLNTTESQRAARQADLTLARQQLERMRALFEAGGVSRSQLDEAEATHTAAAAQLKALDAQVRENQVELEYYRVIAPSSGVIGEISVRPGDRVTPATAITTIDQPEGLEAYINVPLERATQLKAGLIVELLGADGRVIASNPITFIAPRADDATQTVLVKATLAAHRRDYA